MKKQKENSRAGQFVEAVNKFGKLFSTKTYSPWLHSDFIWSLTSYGRESARCVKIMHKFTRSLIKKRKQEILNKGIEVSQKRLALLDLLLKLHLEDPTAITEEQIREEVDTFVFAAHDTTGIAINTSLFEIGHHPDVQDQLHEEIDAIFGDDKTRPTTSDDLKQLPYLDMVLKESMRIYPSAPVVSRHLNEDLQMGDFVLPKGTDVVMSIAALHRDKNVFPDPEKFDPLRFSADEQAKRDPFAFLPFSAGPRSCIGQKFAQLKEKIIVTNILRRYQIETLGRRGDFQQDLGIALDLVTPINIKFTER